MKYSPIEYSKFMRFSNNVHDGAVLREEAGNTILCPYLPYPLGGQDISLCTYSRQQPAGVEGVRLQAARAVLDAVETKSSAEFPAKKTDRVLTCKLCELLAVAHEWE